MLELAEKYEKELNSKLYLHFYDKKNQWYYGDENHKRMMKVTNTKLQYVSITKDGNFNGFISGRYDEQEKIIRGLVLISFNNNNPMLMKDLITFFYKAYKEYEVNSLSFAIYRDAPFYPQAVRAMNKFGAPEITQSERKYKLADGLLHYLDRFTLKADTIDFDKAERFLRIGDKND